MLVTLIMVVLLTATFLYMFSNARFARTRRVALVPLACAGMEVLAAGVLSASLHPLLTGIRLAMIAVILTCCYAAMRKDAAMARRRARRTAARRAPEETVAVPVVCRSDCPACCA